MCTNPLQVRNESIGEFAQYSGRYYVNKIPCGKCSECRARRRTDWAIRLYEESKIWKYASFVTLTYREGELEKKSSFRYAGKDYPLYELNADDTKRYFDLIRKTYKRKYGEQPKICHFICGEYGSHTLRPHYHCLFYFDDERLFPIIRAAWKKGNIYWRMENGKRDYIQLAVHDVRVWKITNYVAKYIAKDDVYYNTQSNELLKDLAKPFLRMTRNIGLNYLAFNTQVNDLINDLWKNHDIRYYAVRTKFKRLMQYEYFGADGQHITLPLPQYYRNKIFKTKGQRLSCILDESAYKVSRQTGEIVKIGFKKCLHTVDRPNALGLAYTRLLQRMYFNEMAKAVSTRGEEKEGMRYYDITHADDIANRKERNRERFIRNARSDKF